MPKKAQLDQISRLQVKDPKEPGEELHSADNGRTVEPYGQLINAMLANQRVDNVRCIAELSSRHAGV